MKSKNGRLIPGCSIGVWFERALQTRCSYQSELSVAQTQLSLLQIASPLTGTLVQLNAELGQSVESNTTLAEILP